MRGQGLLLGALLAFIAPAMALELPTFSDGAASEHVTVNGQPVPMARASWEALQRGNCNLCHTVPGVVPATRVESCTDCHDWIHAISDNPAAREKAMAAFPHWERYEKNVKTYADVPNLEAAMARLEPTWVRDQAP